MNRAQSRRGILALAALLPALALAFGALVAGSRPALADGVAPAVGKPAPAFKLQDQAGKWHSLADYKGKWVALYFYPKDDTPGCTTQACGFRDNIFAFNKEGAVILGISVDDVASHKEFAEKHSLPFTLLADSDKAVTQELRRAEDLHGRDGNGAPRHLHHRPAGPRRQALRVGRPGRPFAGRARRHQGAEGRGGCGQQGRALSWRVAEPATVRDASHDRSG